MDWKRLLKLEEYEVAGLDIGSSSVKIVQLRKGSGGWTVIGAGIAPIASSGSQAEDNRNEINTIRAIGDCWQSTGIQTQLAVCSVSGPEVAVRSFRFPVLPPEELEGAVLLEASQVCPFNVKDASVHYQIIPNGSNNTSGILVAATNRLIERKKRLAKDASLDTVLMDVDGLALLNCFNESQKSQDGVYKEQKQFESGRSIAILNVGNSLTNLAIIGQKALPFIRDISYGGSDIVQRIVEERGFSTEAVDKVFSECEDLGDLQTQLGDSFAEACEKLVVDVAETVRYYTAQEKAAFVEKIFVCGGFALVKGFVEILNRQLPAAVEVWNPFDKMRCDAHLNCSDILAGNGPAMAVAAGLAMRPI